MSKALLESTTRTPAPLPEPEDAGYEPHEWERKLAAARQKREAVLLQRAASRDAPGTEPSAPESPREDRPSAIEAFVAKVQSAAPRPARDTDDAGGVTPGARGWRSMLPTFVAGCAVGAVVVGLLAMTVGSRSASGPGADNSVAQAAPTLAVMTPASEPSPLVARPDPGDAPGAAEAAAVKPAADPSLHAAGTSVASTPVPGAAEAAAGHPPAGPSAHAAGGTDIARAPADAARPGAGTADDRTEQAAAVSEPIDAAPSLDELATAPRPAARPAQASVAVADVPAPGAGWVDLASATPIVATSEAVSPLAASTSRIVVLAPRSVPAAARDEAVSALREFGWPAGEARVSPFTISRTHVRFYHPEDRAAAEDLAAMFSAEARDFTDYARRPERGMLELWMAGRAPVRRQQPARPALPPPVQMIADALGRLAQGPERQR